MKFSEEQVEALRAKAERGDCEAQYEMGWRQAIGMGLPLDDVEALCWLRLAAEQGHKLAQNNLGARYATGDGVRRDLSEAYFWFYQAAEQGDRKAVKNRDSVASEMSEDQLAAVKERLAAL
ncbi:MAG: Secretory immunoglobulin A-binding protein EsiB [Verrucomicrobia subdivision 3 bacterium]|nr:Secretory immunoglobulin A-binding protein EsiB [Limisphaerales bacterium]MCS1414631.1 Secretory immunoglobulin A-binding protein EsiB [Limisphaerales bacterium]